MAKQIVNFVNFIAVLGIVCPVAASETDQRFEFESRHMGTTFRIVVYGKDPEKASAAAKAAFARVAELDRILSDYNRESEVMRLCRANDEEPGKPRPVSRDLFAVLEISQKLAAETDGAFDVTIGPLSQIWRLVRRTQRLPTPEELAAAKAKVGWKFLTLDPDRQTVTLNTAGMRLDFGGIAKGYAADAAYQILAERGFSRAMVAASGDIRVGDPPPGSEGWNLEIAPLGQGMPVRKLTLARAAVSTSGDLFQFVEIDGVRYSHVLDPKTGLGLTGFRSVTVVAPTATLSDGLSTAASLLPREKALQYVEQYPGASLYMVVKASSAAEPVETRSARFPNSSDHGGESR
jgi:thiamine biosynthesis lipoprotein